MCRHREKIKISTTFINHRKIRFSTNDTHENWNHQHIIILFMNDQNNKLTIQRIWHPINFIRNEMKIQSNLEENKKSDGPIEQWNWKQFIVVFFVTNLYWKKMLFKNARQTPPNILAYKYIKFPFPWFLVEFVFLFDLQIKRNVLAVVNQSNHISFVANVFPVFYSISLFWTKFLKNRSHWGC